MADKGGTRDTGTISAGFCLIICFQMETLAHSDKLSQFSVSFLQTSSDVAPPELFFSLAVLDVYQVFVLLLNQEAIM